MVSPLFSLAFLYVNHLDLASSVIMKLLIHNFSIFFYLQCWCDLLVCDQRSHDSCH